MKKEIFDSRGVTLIELLVVLLLISLITIMVYSILISGEKQFTIQSEKNRNQEKVQFVVKYITKEVRKANSFTVENGELIISNANYRLEEDVLVKSTSTTKEILAVGIKNFLVEADDDLLIITIETHGTKREQVKINTRVYSR